MYFLYKKWNVQNVRQRSKCKEDDVDRWHGQLPSQTGSVVRDIIHLFETNFHFPR